MSEYYDGGYEEAAADDCCCPSDEVASTWVEEPAELAGDVYAEPAYTEPVEAEPVYAEPTYAEPTYVAPAAAEPVTAASAATSADALAPAPLAGAGETFVVGPSDAGLYPTTAVIGGDDGPDFTIVGPADVNPFATTAVVGGGGPGFDLPAVGEGTLYPTSMTVGGATSPDGVHSLLNTMSEFVGRSHQQQLDAMAHLAANGIDPAADPSLTQRLLSDWFKGVRNLEDTMSPLYHSGDDLDSNSRFYKDRP